MPTIPLAGKLKRNALFPFLLIIIAIPLGYAFWPAFGGSGFFANSRKVFASPGFLRAFSFGIEQAFFSSLLALVVGLPAGWLLARKRFFGKKILGALSVLPFCIPALVIAIAFALWYGNSGILNKLWMAISGRDEPLNLLYSRTGIILVHGLYNFPVIMRFLALALSSLPAIEEYAASSLGASKRRVMTTIILPSVLPSIMAALSLVFLMCFFSFVIVLLFGPPGISVPEVELYRAARMDLDRSAAAIIALAETLVAMSLLFFHARLENRIARQRKKTGQPVPATGIKTIPERAGFAIYAILLLVFFFGPLLALIAESFMVSGKPGSSYSPGFANYTKLFTSMSFWTAFLNTILLGLSSAAISVTLGLAFSFHTRNRTGSALARVLPMLPLATSSVALAWAWTGILGRSSFLAIALVQAVASYPFALRSIQAAFGSNDELYTKAAASLGSRPLYTLIRVRIPLAMPAIISGFIFAFAISAGDANALIVSPIQGFETLALRLYRTAGSYRFNEACAQAVLLGIFTSSLFLGWKESNAASGTRQNKKILV